MKKRDYTKRVPPNNVRFNSRDCCLVDGMSDGSRGRTRFHRTFGPNAKGNNKQEQ